MKTNNLTALVLSSAVALSSLFGCAESRNQTRNPEFPSYVEPNGSCAIFKIGIDSGESYAKPGYGRNKFKLIEIDVCDIDGDGNVDRIEAEKLGIRLYTFYLNGKGEVVKLSTWVPMIDKDCILGDYVSDNYADYRPIKEGCRLKGELLSRAQKIADAGIEYFRIQNEK